MRNLVAGILGGIAMFVWSSIAHVVLPLGATGVSQISNEQPLLDSMHATLGQSSGLYIFPALGNASDAAAFQEYQQKIAVGPSGILIYHPSGGQALSPGQLLAELLSEVLGAFIAVLLLAQTRLESFGSRVGFVSLAGILAALPTNVAYWNWYGFPTSYTAAYMSIQIIGFVVAGIVAAAVMKKRSRVTAPVAA